MKDKLIYLNHIRDAIDDIREFSHGNQRDKKTRAAVIRELEVIGEATNRLPEAFRAQHPDIPWRDMIDMRNALSHGYDLIRDDILWHTIQHDLDSLYEQITVLLNITKKGQ